MNDQKTKGKDGDCRLEMGIKPPGLLGRLFDIIVPPKREAYKDDPEADS